MTRVSLSYLGHAKTVQEKQERAAQKAVHNVKSVALDPKHTLLNSIRAFVSKRSRTIGSSR